ncbi:DUF1330 domain-containing protein [Streptomyces sp. NBC_01456]|uniref:DUF1330 domain-containing protein n=1 Tax=unclassified Streptomyces TaxID=2593676 RepID=UPI002E37F67B|nr:MULTISPECIES: DUF1330 domain-containing protein [unclassified Streptomyces]
MTAYAIVHARKITMGPSIKEYLERIEATSQPFRGQFLVHGGDVEVVEGDWPGSVVVIAFPDLDLAHAWYASAAYQEILPLRTQNAEADMIFVQGVSAEHRATDLPAH